MGLTSWVLTAMAVTASFAFAFAVISGSTIIGTTGGFTAGMIWILVNIDHIY